MKVRIEYTVEVDDDFRRGINVHYGQPGLATRKDVKDWYRDFGRSMDLDVLAHLESRAEAVGLGDEEREGSGH